MFLLNYFTLKKFINSNIFIGHSIKQVNINNFIYLLGIRNNLFLINIEYTFLQFRLAVLFLTNIPIEKRAANICFLGLNKALSTYIKYSALRAKQFYFINKWTNGYFSNFKELFKNKKFSLFFTNLTRLPFSVICFNLDKKSYLASECKNSGIISIGIIDSNIEPSCVVYPIAGNDDSLSAIVLYSDIFSKILIKARFKEIRRLKEKCKKLNLKFCYMFYKNFLIFLKLNLIFIKLKNYKFIFNRRLLLFNSFFFKYYYSNNDLLFINYSLIRGAIFRQKLRKALIRKCFLKNYKYIWFWNFQKKLWWYKKYKKRWKRISFRFERNHKSKWKRKKFFRRFYSQLKRFINLIEIFKYKNVKKNFYLLEKYFILRFFLRRGFWFKRKFKRNKYKYKLWKKKKL